MVGRDIDQLLPAAHAAPAAPRSLLEARGLDQPGRGQGHRPSAVHAGEVLGLFGLMGSGRTELARILFGLDPFDRRRARRRRQRRSTGDPAPRASPRGIAFVTENRREEGLLMNAPIADNIALAVAAATSAAAPLGSSTTTRLPRAPASMAATLQHQAPARIAADAGQEPLRRQPAEGRHRQVADGRPARSSSSTSRRAASTSAPSTRSTRSSTGSPPTAAASSSSPPRSRS